MSTEAPTSQVGRREVTRANGGAFDPFWLGHALLAAGHLTQPQLASAIGQFKQRGGDSFESVLESLALADQHTIAAYTGRHFGLPVVEIPPGSVSTRIVSLFPGPRARAVGAVPIAINAGELTLAVADPRKYGIRDAERDFPGRRVKLVIAARNDILTAIELAAAPEVGAEATPKDRLRAILTEAIRRRANDVHLESHPNALVVRYRIDNELVHRDHLDASMKGLLIQAAKTFASIDLAEKRLPQDGHGKLTVGAQTYSFRLNTVPTYHGEDATIRIQTEGSRIMPLADLGLRPESIALFARIMERPYGMIYITGPTGSGKTTLLFSLLGTQPTLDEKVITLEDPIEIVVPSYRQIQIDESIGRTFPLMMRAIVRQDPDRILLGETRDLESARIAIQAALTGHKVYSTLHTNDAPSAIPRLVDIGVEPYLIASALSGIAACRLVRRLCPQCRQRVSSEQSDALCRDYGEGTYFQPYREGCAQCNRGYQGRTAIVEVYPVDHDEIQSLILRRTPVHDLRREFNEILGLPDMRADGLAKARAGLTTVEEVLAQV